MILRFICCVGVVSGYQTPRPPRPVLGVVRARVGVDEATTPLPSTDDEWKERLTPEQYYILREEGTEPAYSSKFNDIKAQGVFQCAGCKQGRVTPHGTPPKPACDRAERVFYLIKTRRPAAPAPARQQCSSGRKKSTSLGAGGLAFTRPLATRWRRRQTTN